MSINTSQPSRSPVLVDRWLADPTLLNEPRALLLLKICQVAQVLRPDILQRYWELLRNVSGSLPIEHREAFEGLRAAIEPPPKSSLGKFAQEIVDSVNTGVEIAKSNRDEAFRIFRDCQQRLHKHWWSFGKEHAWIALVLAWADVDRTECLKLIAHVPQGVQQNILVRLNDLSPLTPEEWDLAREHAASDSSIIQILNTILDRDKPELHLGPKLAETVGQALIRETQTVAPNEDMERKIKAQREKAVLHYFKLVLCLNDGSTDIAETLMERLFLAVANPSTLIALLGVPNGWLTQLASIRRLISYWSNFPALRERALSFLTQNDYLRDFCLSHWYGSIPTSDQDVMIAWQSLNLVCSDKVSSQAWFFITLLERGMEEIVLKLVCSSPYAQELMPGLRMVWLVLKPESASSAISLQDVEGDLIGQFLLLGSINKRVEFLRQQTERGKISLPKEMWSQPNFGDLFFASTSPGEHSFLNIFRTNEAPEGPFREYLRISGFSRYCYELIDPYLLATLVAWDEEHPAEVKSVLGQMWLVMKPGPSRLRDDLLRNAIFERCQTLFAASPTFLNESFIKWIKQELVDRAAREQVGQTIYTFSLQGIAPFLYCLFSAQKIAILSPKRRDEILTYVIREYPTNEELMATAAELFASDKGLRALHPPAHLKDPAHLKAWQLGVIQASLQEILLSFLVGFQKEEVTSTSATHEKIDEARPSLVDSVGTVVEPLQGGGAASSPAASVTIDGISFPLVNSVAALCTIIEAEGKGALRFPSLTYQKVLLDLTQWLEKRYGRNSRQYQDAIPSSLVCAGCLWEFPGSYKLSLQGAFPVKEVVFGATTGFDQFGTSGICPQCGSSESLLIYECFPPEQISMSDIDAIRRYWQQQARIQWQSQQTQEAFCDYCNTTIARNQGYLSGSSLICEECVTKGLMTEGLQKLKSDPHYYGAALLRKARHFHT